MYRVSFWEIKIVTASPVFQDIHLKRVNGKFSQLRMLFSQDVFKGLEDEADEDLEISQMVEEYKNQGGTILGNLSRL